MIFLLLTWSAFPHPPQACFSDFIACIISILLLAQSAHWFCCFKNSALLQDFEFAIPCIWCGILQVIHMTCTLTSFHFSVNPSLVITFKNFIFLPDISLSPLVFISFLLNMYPYLMYCIWLLMFIVFLSH